jgi:hypothetical protein
VEIKDGSAKQFGEAFRWSFARIPGEGTGKGTMMKAPARCPEVYRPHLFASGDERFADVVAACFLFASVGTRDCYLADADGMEAYLAHHHDKVVVSIPDGEVRDVVVREITEAARLFEDVSGYVFSGDEDQGPDN